MHAPIEYPDIKAEKDHRQGMYPKVYQFVRENTPPRLTERIGLKEYMDKLSTSHDLPVDTVKEIITDCGYVLDLQDDYAFESFYNPRLIIACKECVEKNSTRLKRFVASPYTIPGRDIIIGRPIKLKCGLSFYDYSDALIGLPCTGDVVRDLEKNNWYVLETR